MTPLLPRDAVAYRRTPIFTEATLPAGLRHRHQTKAGVWGLIVVVEGRLRFRSLEPRLETVLDSAGAAAVAAPEQPHEVEPLGAVRFFIEFYTVPTPADAVAGRSAPL